MNDWMMLKKSALIGFGLVVFLLIFGAAAALAADTSNPTSYNDDNYSEGFSSFYPHNCWRSFDMIFYKGQVWESFCKKEHTGYPDEEISVYVATNEATAAPSSEPTHYHVVEPGQTWADSDSGDLRRPNIARFAVFKDKLFLYIGKTYDYDTGSILWQKQIDPLDATYIGPNDDTRWNPPGTAIWSNRPGSSNPRVIKGLVAKVMNDTLCMFVQYGGTRDLYSITTTDTVNFSTPKKIHTFAGNDCLLNGDVIARGSDGAPLLAFLTKDDAGDTTTGTIKLWTFDPQATTNAVNYVATLPGHDPSPGAYRDATLLAGDVAGCTPYGNRNLQLWGIGWGSSNVYHMQFAFNPDGKSGVFDPVGIVDHGSASDHVEKGDRGYLASCMAPELTSDSSLQQYARVWWWGSTDASNAHGRSLKYAMDYLKRLEPKSVDTAPIEYSPAWVLQGVIYGLPPYYPNGTQVGFLAASYYVAFGLEYSQMVSNSVTSEKTLSVSYENQGILGIPSASMGLGWSNAVQQTSSSTTKVTQGSILKWSPDTKGAPPPADGAQAWGVFFVPTITNDRYHVFGPDKTTDLHVELYYTYISSGVDLIDKVFDKTDPESADLGQATKDYWTGTTPWPNSMTYWDPWWTSSQTLISPAGSDTYENILPAKFWSASSGSAAINRYIATENTTEQSKTSTNKIDVSASAFGFSTSMSGSLSIASSTATTFGQKLDVLYGLPGWNASLIDPNNPPLHYSDYLKRMDMYMYLLRAKGEDAFWIPDGAKEYGIQNYPWCITWHVNYWESQGTTDQHGMHGPSVATMVGNTQTDVARTVALPAGLRASLTAKMKAIRTAYDRGNKVAAANIVGALINEIEAQSGKAIPTTSAEYWLHLLELVKPMMMQ